ncbi:MAG TPA: PDZ domain-containing protein [Symbiobacteriaceae bacterium]
MAALLNITRLLFKTLPDMILSGWAVLLLLVAGAVVFLQYRRVAVTEAELFGIPKHTPLSQTLQSLALGALGGIAGSLLLSLAGVGLVEAPGAASALLYLWPVSIGLGAINPRFICFAYSGTLLSLSYLVFGWPKVDVASLVGLIAIMHMVEAFLIWVSGPTCATPMTIGGQDGEPVAGFTLQRFWPVPLVLPLFALAGHAPMAMPTWWPLLRPDAAMAGGALPFGWQLVPVVVTMGYSDLAISAPPSQRARQSSQTLLVYSGLLLLLAVASSHFRPLLWVAALFSGLGHEAMAVLSGRLQLLGVPYLRRPPKGVGILDVLPGSPAEAGGLRSGAVVLTVDDYEVHSREEFHDALLEAPPYVRIMFRMGRQLEHCRVPRPAQGLFGFGAILLPEPGDRALAKLRRPAFFRRSRLE